MADRASSPFSGLDKALLRSTRPSGPARDPEDTRTNVEPRPAPAQSTVIELQRSDIPAAPGAPLPDSSQAVLPNARSGERPDARTGQKRRKIIRHSFQIYEDQLEELRRLSLEAQLRGEGPATGMMSVMVRETIDRYLKDHATKK
jgi:hypothetical protein